MPVLSGTPGGVVVSVTAGGTDVIIGGTGTAPTIDVAATNGLGPTGTIAETFPRGVAVADAVGLTSGTMKCFGLRLTSGLLITSITFVSGTTALATGTHQLFGLYDSGINLLRGSTDDTNTAWAANTAKTLNLTSTYTTVAAGFFYVAIMVAATTPPNLYGYGSGTAVTGIAPILFGSSTTGLTALPATGAALTALGAGAYCYLK